MTSSHIPVVVLGAGISGLAVSYHLRHTNTLILEQGPYYGGHVHSEVVDGFVWDDGPHISSPRTLREGLSRRHGRRRVRSRRVESLELLPGTLDRPSRAGPPLPGARAAAVEPASTASCRRVTLAGTPRNYREWIHMAFGRSVRRDLPGRLYPQVLDDGASRPRHRLGRQPGHEAQRRRRCGGAKASIGIQDHPLRPRPGHRVTRRMAGSWPTRTRWLVAPTSG